MKCTVIHSSVSQSLSARAEQNSFCTNRWTIECRRRGKTPEGCEVAGCEQVVRGKPRLHSNGWCCLLYKCHSRAKKVGLVSTAAVLLDLKIDRFIIYIKGSGCSEKWGLIGFCWHWWFQLTSHWWSCGGICEAWRRWKLRCDCVSKFTLKEIVFWC